ncbi:MAG TPA: YicC/YloC family endoribonuclease [Bryobacteraceae bacterium]|jgi:uncharacterized protein (TIGR00255 family)
MTGFARVRKPCQDGELVVSIKSVNHRGLDVHLRAPESVDAYERLIRGLVQARMSRGHVEVRVSLPGSAAGAGVPVLNQALLEAYLKAFQDAVEAHDLDAEPDLNAALRVPGMFSAPAETEPDTDLGPLLVEAVGAALDQLNAFREREGAELAAEMRKHNAHAAAVAAEMEQIREGAAEAFQSRLTERLKDLLKGAQVEPQRLAQEAAILADRSDIGEELARLKMHSAQLGALLDGGGEVGKKLDFLLQEMNRETNTVLSKTNGIGETGLKITELGLAAKADIEKIREQSLNLE